MVTIPTVYETAEQTNITLTQVIISSIVIFLVVSNNFLILLAFALEKRLRVYTNYYVVNMAIADGLVGLVAMGFSLWQSLMNFRWSFGHISCSIIMSITHTLLHVSIVMIAVISIDRCCAVYYPLRHLQQRSKMNAIRRNSLVWVVCFIFWGSFIGVWRQLDEARHDTVSCGPLYNRYVFGTLVVTSAYYWIPATIIGVMNICIYYKIRSSGGHQISKTFKVNKKISLDVSKSSAFRGSQTSISCVSMTDTFKVPFESEVSTGDDLVAHQEDRNSSGRNISEEEREDRVEKVNKEKTLPRGGRTRREQEPREHGHRNALGGKKAQRTLSLLIIALIITWTPYSAVIGISTYCRIQMTSSCIPRLLFRFVLWLSWANSLLNPFMYAVAQPLFRETILKMFWRK